MLHQGQAVGLEVFWPVEIYGQWHTLSATASTWAAESSAAAEQMESASSSWTGLVSSYREAETQEIVRTALDEAPEVTREWAGVVGRAADVLQSFATEANGLQQQAAALEGQATRLQARLWASNLLSGGGDDEDTSAEDAALRGEIEVHNSDVMALNSKWQQLEQQTASEIDSIASGGGYQDEIPVINTDGAGFGPAAGGLGTAGLTSGGFAAGGSLAGGALAGGSLNGGAGLGIGFQSAVGQMIRSGNYDPVDTATKLYETVTSDEVTGEDVKALYNQLGQMDADQIEEFAEANPEINHYSIPQPSSDEELGSWPTGEFGADWWDTMGDNGTQNAMLAALPLLTGNTEGVRYSTRHLANRNALRDLRNSQDLQPHQRSRLDEINKSLNAGPDRMLLSLDMGQDPTTPGPKSDPPSADPLAAVSVGNPDSADTTTFDVAGMFSDTDDMPDEVRGAQYLYSGLEESSNEHAVVSWIGYDSPGYGTVLGEGKADDGSWALAYALDGYRETMDARGKETRVNVNAHSYGTNTAAYALTRTTHNVDSYTMYGSAGIHTDAAEHASELNVAKTDEGRRAVYAADANNDSTSDIGKNLSGRADPTDTDFGAYVFSADGTGNPPGYPVDGHSQVEEVAGEYGYRDRNSQVYESLLLINDDSADQVDMKTETTVEYYQELFDQHVETKLVGQYHGNTYYPGAEYQVSIDGQTRQVETRDEAMKLINDHYSEQSYTRADQADVQAEANEQYYRSVAEHRFDDHATTRMVDDGGGFSLVPRTGFEVVLDGQSHRVETREEALGLIADHYAAQHDGPAQEDS